MPAKAAKKPVKPAKTTKVKANSKDILSSLASPERIQQLLDETTQELESIQPRIAELEAMADELKELRSNKQRLLTLKMSLGAMLEGMNRISIDDILPAESLRTQSVSDEDFNLLAATQEFSTERAMQQVDQVLKQRDSLNYEMFKAVAHLGGKATTQEIKDFMVNAGVHMPQTGQNFEEVPLTEVSSRLNYLVRKGVLRPLGRGHFFTQLGWE